MEKPVEVTPKEARQGRLGKPVATILVISLLLAAVSWVGLGIYGEQADDAANTVAPSTTNQNVN